MNMSAFLRTAHAALSFRQGRAHLIAILLVSLFPTLASAQARAPELSAAATGADANALEQRILDRLKKGEPVGELVRQWKQKTADKNTTARATAAAATKSEVAKRQGHPDVLKAGLQALRAALQVQDKSQASGDAWAVAVKAFYDAEAQLEAGFGEARGKLDSAASSPVFQARLEAARQRVQQSFAPLKAELAALPPGANGTSSPPDVAAARRIAPLIEALLAEPPTPVLRASTLPVRPANLPARTPVDAPAIKPAYLTTTEHGFNGADLAPGAEAPFSDEILDKAKALEYDYVRIFEFVRNDVRTEWYAGSQKGATGVLRTLGGNAVDQASLLIALLRASGAPARYVQGVVDLPVETIAAQLGIADASQAVDALVKSGIAAQGVVQGGRVARVRFEHVWVAALVPYTNYRGVVLDSTGKTWLPLDAWFKRIEGRSATPALTRIGQSGAALAESYRGADRSADLLEFLKGALTSALQGVSYESALGAARVQAQRLDILPNTLPYNVVAVTRESAELDTQLKVTVQLKLTASSGANGALDVQFPLHELVNNRVTLSYDAATVDDHRTSLLWGSIDQTPAYLVRLRPQLHMAGRLRAAGTDELQPGSTAAFQAIITGPFGTQQLDQNLTVGAYHALAFFNGGLAHPTGTLVGDNEFLAASLLDGIAIAYANTWKAADDELALLTGSAVLRPLPALVMVNNVLRTDQIANVTFSASWRGVSMDAISRVSDVVGEGRKDWMILSALQGSSLEQLIFQRQFQVDSVSADRVLALAGASVKLSGSGADAQAAALPFDSNIKDDIRNWLRLGYTVTTHGGPFNRNAWTGAGWLVEDPASGAAGYFLAGRIAGGMSSLSPTDWLLSFVADALANPHGSTANRDPGSAVSISVLEDTDEQKGTVNKALEKPLAVLVRDKSGQPVKGANVTFNVMRGDGRLEGEVLSFNTTTDATGVARAGYRLGSSTAVSSVYFDRNPGDKHPTRAGQNLVDAFVAGSGGSTIRLTGPIKAYAFPDQPVALTGDVLKSVVTVSDMHGNPVANVDVSLNSNSASATCSELPGKAELLHFGDPETCPPAATWGACGGDRLLVKSDSLGKARYLLLIDHADGGIYNFTVDAVGVSLSGTYTRHSCVPDGTRPFLVARTGFDDQGLPLLAAGVGQPLKVPVSFSFYIAESANFTKEVNYDDEGNPKSCTVKYGPERVLKPVLDATLEIVVSDGGFASGVVPGAPGEYLASLVAGPEPVLHTLTAIAKGRANGWKFEKDCTKTITQEDVIAQMDESTGLRFFAVKPEVVSAKSIDLPEALSSEKAYLDSNGRLQYPVQIDYQIKPDNFTGQIVETDLFLDGLFTDYFSGSSLRGAGNIRIERGYRMTNAEQAQAEIVINRGDKEIRSPRTILPFKRSIIQGVRVEEEISGIEEPPPQTSIIEGIETKAKISTDVDFANERICQVRGQYSFEIGREATVSLVAYPLSDAGDPIAGTATVVGSPVTVFSGRLLAKGRYTEILEPSLFLPRLNGYRLELKAISSSDPGNPEVAATHLQVTYAMSDSLPVGQVLVKGVNVKSGRLVVAGQSIQVAGRGPQLAFRPVYSSAGGGYGNGLGANWSHNFESSLRINPCGEVSLNAGDGGSMRFFPQLDGSFKPAKGYHGTLIANKSDKTFDYYSKDGTQHRFVPVPSTKGWLLDKIIDTNGNTLTITRDTNAFGAPILGVTDSSGRTLNFEWKSLPQLGLGAKAIASVSGPDGMRLSFQYDDIGNLISSSRESGANSKETYQYSTGASIAFRNLMTAFSNAGGQVTAFDYLLQTSDYRFTSPNNPVQVSLPDGKVSSVIAADGGRTRFNYIPGENGQTTTVLDPNGKATTYVLNKYGSPLTVTTPAGTTENTWAADDILMTSKRDGNGVLTTYEYDPDGNLTSESVSGRGVSLSMSQTWLRQTTAPFIKNKVTSRTDWNGRTTSYNYDTAGNLLQERRPENVTLSYSYAQNGDRITFVDGKGGTTKYQYDGSGNLTSTIDPLNKAIRTPRDARGRVTSITDQNNRTTRFTYDFLDHLIEKTDPAGKTHSMVVDVLGNKVLEEDEAGRITRYSYDKMNRVTSITRPIGSKVIGYDAAGNKTSETDWNGRITRYAYDAANRLVQRVEPLGKETTYSYDAVGNVTSETDGEGNVTRHAYDGLNRRTSTTDAANGLWTFSYDGNGNKIAEVDSLGRRASFVFDGLNRLKSKTADATGVAATTAFTYDGNGNVLTVTDPQGRRTAHTYDANNRKESTLDAEGNLTKFTYDPVGNKLQEINPRGYARNYSYDALNRVVTFQDEDKHLTSYSYDPVGNKTGESLPNGNDVFHTYDALNRLTATRDSIGTVLRKSYDAQGNVLSETDANGNITTHVYDTLNRRVETSSPSAAGTRVRKFGYDLVGNLTSETDANNNTISHTYDALNRRTLSTDSLGEVRRVSYDKVGNPLTETDANGNTDTHVYDGLNRRTSTRDSLGTVMSIVYDKVGNKVRVTDARDIDTVTTFDKLNRPLTVTRAGVLMVTNEYDEVGNIRFVTDARGNKVGYEYDGRNLKLAENRSLGAITRFTLSNMGDVLTVTDPEGRVTRNSYDLRRRLESTTNGSGETTQYAFDANGNRTRITEARNNTQTFGYDAANRLVAVTTPAGAAGLGYDKHGNLTRRQDANQHASTYEYDARHRRSKTTFADGQSETQTHDGNGNLKTLTDANGTVTTYTYDARDRETRKAYSVSADGLTQIDTQYDGNGNITETKEIYAATSNTPAVTRTHTRGYDDFNRLERETDPWGDVITHRYDAQGNRTGTTAKGSTTTYSYDELNRRTSVTTAGGTVSTTYDRTGLPTEIRYPNGAITQNEYDAALRVKTIVTLKGTTELERTTYTFDLNGNRKSQTRTVAAAGPIAGESETTQYQYDNDDRLTEVAVSRTQGATSTTQTVVYTLDPAGNRTQETSTGSIAGFNYVKTTTYDPRDRITRIDTTGTGTGTNQPGTTTFDYDPNGNLTSKTRGTTQRLFTWNARDRLVEVKEGSLILGRYKYNAEGYRDEIEGKRRTTWVGGFAYLDKDPANGLLAKYETQANGRSPLLVATPSGTEYLHADSLGSTTLATATDGTAKATTRFDSFGNSETQGFSLNKFGFTGHETDADTGLIYFKARHYDPELGRFISADPFEGEPTIPVSWNSYLYANGNPLYYIDKNGYCSGVGAPGGDSLIGCAWDWLMGKVSGGASKVVDKAIEKTQQQGDLVDMGGPTPTLNPWHAIGFGAQVVEKNPELAVAAPLIAKPFMRSGKIASAVESQTAAQTMQRGSAAEKQAMKARASTATEGKAAEQASIRGGTGASAQPNITGTTGVNVAERQNGLGVNGRVDSATAPKSAPAKLSSSEEAAAQRKQVIENNIARDDAPLGLKKTTVEDFPEVAEKVSQKQLRHIGGRQEHKARGGGYLDSVEDAQAVLDAYRSGSAEVIGKSTQGFPIVKVDSVTGTNVNARAGIDSQATNVFMIKGTSSPSVVPVNPNWKK